MKENLEAEKRHESKLPVIEEEEEANATFLKASYLENEKNNDQVSTEEDAKWKIVEIYWTINLC